ncbi:NAD(P)-dependent oxidoreductase [Bosea sp. BK604]|uniref:NAD-dependent epimerase/dehydratase family protein n=1 Tax=Bosea sp. BK604 TaxID=2512180 RepID=UPI0010F17BE2|nr:NAD(P)-dependent oxidoreductase [Bosea sp. BK604]TCR66414.1 nucleoside-diphosphate-sugar epimerase [Bosea sp. BK604]
MSSADTARTVLVAGGLGFVGSHVVRALVHAGYAPVLFGPAMAEDRLADIGGRYEVFEGSIGDRDALTAAFARFKPAQVISCVAHSVGKEGLMRAGEAESDTAMEINVAGHGKLIDAACRAGVKRIVWTGSSVVYGPASTYATSHVDEGDVSAPTTVYGLTKHLAEELSAFMTRRYGVEIVSMRLPLILGPGLWYQGAASAISEVFAAARENRPARISFHDHAVDLMHVVDAAAAMLAVLRHPGPVRSTYNIKGFEANITNLIEAVRSRKPGTGIAFERIEPALLLPLMDGSRFVGETGFSPRFDLAGLVADMLAPAPENAP